MPLEVWSTRLMSGSALDKCALVGRLIACLIVATIGTESLVAQTLDIRESSVIRPGVVLDGSSSIAVLMSPDGGSEAVKVEDGETLWTSDLADRPLIASRDRLLAQSDTNDGSLVLIIVELTSGEPIARVQAELPDGAAAIIDDQLDRKFEIEARAVEDYVLLHWTNTVKPVAAVQRLQKEAEIFEGILRVDWEGNAIEPMRFAEYSAAFKKLSANLIDNERVGDGDGVQFRAATGDFVLVSEQVADNRSLDKYQWTLLDPTNGEVVGKFSDFQRYNSFGVLGQVLLQEVAPHVRVVEQDPITYPLSIRALKLQDGEEIWQRSIRDTTYRGLRPH